MHPAMESPFRQSHARDHGPSLMDRLRRALDDQDLESFADLYTEDATLEEVSSLSPPSHPKVARGRAAILEVLRAEILRDPVSGWARHLQSSAIIDGIETDDAIAFTELRTYAAGDKVVAQHLAHKHGGRIERDRMVIAWDAD
jgi:ketosteroid isomerase-like protein